MTATDSIARALPAIPRPSPRRFALSSLEGMRARNLDYRRSSMG